MDTQEIVLTHNSDDGLYTQLLRGRYVTSIDDGTITLDDGTELYIQSTATKGAAAAKAAGTGSKTSTSREAGAPAS